MLKSILNLGGAQGLTKNEQKSIQGGFLNMTPMSQSECQLTCDDCRRFYPSGYYCHGEVGGYGGPQKR